MIERAEQRELDERRSRVDAWVAERKAARAAAARRAQQQGAKAAPPKTAALRRTYTDEYQRL